MKEYWINVYLDDNGIWYGRPYRTRLQAIAITMTYSGVLYRIHVKMK